MSKTLELSLFEKYAVYIKNTYKDDGRYKTASDFKNPFFIVMHEEEGEKTMNHRAFSRMYPIIFEKQRDELKHIKRVYDFFAYNMYPPTVILPEIPRKRPILVTGCFDTDCVEKQKRALLAAGFQAYISFEGTFPLIDSEIPEDSIYLR